MVLWRFKSTLFSIAWHSIVSYLHAVSCKRKTSSHINGFNLHFSCMSFLGSSQNDEKICHLREPVNSSSYHLCSIETGDSDAFPDWEDLKGDLLTALAVGTAGGAFHPEKLHSWSFPSWAFHRFFLGTCFFFHFLPVLWPT